MDVSAEALSTGTIHYAVLRAKTHNLLDLELRRALYEKLDAACSESGVRIHAFCCGPRDLRLLVEVVPGIDQPHTSEVVPHEAHNFLSRLVMSRSHVAPRFEHAYRIARLSEEFQLLELVLFIHRMHLRSRMANDSDGSAISSYPAYCQSESIPWVTTGRTLAMLDTDVSRARILLDQCLSAWAECGSENESRLIETHLANIADGPSASCDPESGGQRKGH